MGVRWDDAADERLRSWQKEAKGLHERHAEEGVVCRNCPAERYRREALLSDVHTWDLWLLATLFGPGTLATRRGLLVARTALALGALLVVALGALALSALADALVDPSPPMDDLP